MVARFKSRSHLGAAQEAGCHSGDSFARPELHGSVFDWPGQRAQIRRAEHLSAPLFGCNRFDASIEAEVDLDGDHDGDWDVAVFHGGLELVLAHRFKSFFIQAHAQGTNDTRVLWISLRVHDE